MSNTPLNGITLGRKKRRVEVGEGVVTVSNNSHKNPELPLPKREFGISHLPKAETSTARLSKLPEISVPRGAEGGISFRCCF